VKCRYTRLVTSNEGFVGLHNPLGVFLILLCAFLTVMIIIYGARKVKQKEISDKAYRAELRRQIEERKL
jgi:hypothetical protein